MSRNPYPNTIVAYDAGYKAGVKEEQERAASEGNRPTDNGPAPMTLDAIKAGEFSDAELLARADEVNALLQGTES